MSAIRFLSCLVFLTQTTSLNPNKVGERLLFKYVHAYKMFVRMLSGRLMRRKVNILSVTVFVNGLSYEITLKTLRVTSVAGIKRRTEGGC